MKEAEGLAKGAMKEAEGALKEAEGLAKGAMKEAEGLAKGALKEAGALVQSPAGALAKIPVQMPIPLKGGLPVPASPVGTLVQRTTTTMVRPRTPGEKKAYILNKDTNERIPCLFNPNEQTFEKSNTWNIEHIVGENVPKIEYTGGEPATLTLELFFDTYEDGTDVREYTEKVWKLMQVEAKTKNQRTDRGRPPIVVFTWGSTWSFEAVITRISQKFTLFLEDGKPVRATLSVTFKQVKDEGTYPRQNPTSGGVGKTVRLVRPLDTLAWIAHEEYGDATKWRAIAEENDLDDPLHLVPGQSLVIPPLTPI
jgi:nucleoid-associated protein YgaU